MSTHEELVKQFREQQHKYAYYIIALCVAGIGFVTTQTMGKPLKITQIPVGFAVLAWCISISSGLNFIQYQISGLFNNIEYLKMPEGTNKLTGTHPEKIKMGMKIMEELLEKTSRKASRAAQWQDRFFYMGIGGFIVWHVLEMIQAGGGLAFLK
jgi:hypothetical protein